MVHAEDRFRRATTRTEVAALSSSAAKEQPEVVEKYA
jgi:hypothetical protein